MALRPHAGDPQRPLRRPVHVRPREYSPRSRRLLGWRPAVVGARLSARRAEPDADHERGQLLDARTDDINVLTLDDPELFKYPIAYIIEVGWWTLTDAGAAALRAYMQKGGFLIVDDFKMHGWRGDDDRRLGAVRANMNRVLPGVKFFDMDDVASDLPLVLRDQHARQFPAGLQRRHGRCSAASTRTTTRRSGC